MNGGGGGGVGIGVAVVEASQGLLEPTTTMTTTTTITVSRRRRLLLGPAMAAHHRHLLGVNHRDSGDDGRTLLIDSWNTTHRRSYTFWSWRGGGGDEEADEGSQSPQVSSFMLGGARSTATKMSSASSSKTLSSKKSSSSSASSSSSSSSPSSQSVSTYPVSVCTAQGHRSYMEDDFCVSNDGDFAACFDGHGGAAVSRYLRKNLYANVQAFLARGKVDGGGGDDDSNSSSTISTPIDHAAHVPVFVSGSRTDSNLMIHQPSPIPSPPSVDDYATALEYALDKCDREVDRISHWSFQGSTAIVVWLHEETVEDITSNENVSTASATTTTTPTTTMLPPRTSKRTILAANIGDSRAVLCRNETAWDLSRDHKPNDPTERERIERNGGRVIWCGETDAFGNPIEERGIYRVNGNLALSRAVGDRSEKPAVTAEPEIISVPLLEEEDSFIILATDGLWDVMESDDAVAYVLELQEVGLSKKKIATQVVEEALRRGTYDNLTVVIIWLQDRHEK